MKIYFFLDDYDSLLKAQIDYGGYDEIIEGEDLDDLIHICERYGYEVDDDFVITNYAEEIIDEFNAYNLEDTFDPTKHVKLNMKLSRKNPALGKTVVLASLIAAIGFTGIGIKLHRENQANELLDDFTPAQSMGVSLEKEATPTDKPVITEIIESIESPKVEEEVAVSEKPVEEVKATPTPKPSEEVKATPTPKPSEEVKATPAPKPSEEVNKEAELELMLSEKEGFHFAYQDRSKDASIVNAKEYDDLFEKYAKMYGLDKNLLAAIAAQESSGNHYNHLNGPGYGLMQIEYVHFGETLSAYNFETKTQDSITVTKDAVSNLETNIKIGAIILRNELNRFNCNIPLAVAAYNLGAGNINTVLKNTSNRTGVSIDSMKNNPNGNVWTAGPERQALGVGDPKYPDHVFSYLGTKQITVLNKDGNPITVNLINDNNLEMQR